MATTWEVPICTVNTNSIRHLNTSIENLHSLWSVFSKCGDSMEDGQRLANLSWRIMTREALVSSSLSDSRNTSPVAITPQPSKAEVPHLSESVDSLASDSSDHSDTPVQSIPKPHTAPVDIQQQTLHPQPSTSLASRERRKHISPLRLERMVESIQERQRLSALSPSIVKAVSFAPPAQAPPPRATSHSSTNPPHPSLRSSESSTSTAPLSSPDSNLSAIRTVGSDTSAELLMSHSIIRGFSPNQTSSSYRSKTHLAPVATPAKAPSHTKNVQPNFVLGGSSGEDESSFEEHMPPQPRQSSLTVGLKKPAPTKTKTFKEELASKKAYEDAEVFVSSDEEDSSAIDDDSDDEDDENWEEASEGEDAGDGKPLFTRVDSKPNLVSRRSLLTSQLHEGDRQTAFAEMAQSQPALRKAKTQVRMEPPAGEPLILGPHMKRSKPIGMASSNAQATPIAFSPRTTRRHMLATEMTESLRKAVLFERQQKKATASAVLNRRHTTQDLTKIQDYPEEEAESSKDQRAWNDDYSSNGVGDYHQAGW